VERYLGQVVSTQIPAAQAVVPQLVRKAVAAAAAAAFAAVARQVRVAQQSFPMALGSNLRPMRGPVLRPAQGPMLRPVLWRKQYESTTYPAPTDPRTKQRVAQS
jgi:hypothetical protein